MDYIRFKNFRSFEDTGFVEMKKLNLLIGSNSSGKSTFIRFFPLLRQSVETETKGPILWYDRYVDFGTFDNAIRRDHKGGDITFSFKFNRSSFCTDGVYIFNDFDDGKAVPDVSIEVCLSKMKKGWQTYISNFEVVLDWPDGEKDSVEVALDQSDENKVNVTINEKKINIDCHVNAQSVIPEVLNNSPDGDGFTHGKYYVFYSDYAKCIRQVMSSSSAKPDVIRRIVEKINPNSRGKFIADATKVLTGQLANENNNTLFDNLHRVWLLNYVCQLLFIVRRSVHGMAEQTHYITPTRANAERFYRLKDLQVNHVDFDGKNLAMFLNNLSDQNKKHFSSWCFENFAINITTKEKDGQLSIYVNDAQTGHDENIIDTGFGYSQVMPIIASLWSAVRSQNTSRRGGLFFPVRKFPTVFVIEQPELHLHPKLQARLGDIFTKSIQVAEENEIDIRLFIETHSETLVNKIARNIAVKNSGLIDDFQIMIFEKKNKVTTLRNATLSSNGVVQNWPYGFFEEDDIEVGAFDDEFNMENFE